MLWLAATRKKPPKRPPVPIEPAAEAGPTPKKPPARPQGPVAVLDAIPLMKPAFHASTSPQWAVQVGAFGAFTQARVVALNAAERAPHQLIGAEIQIVPFATEGAVLYRARLLGLDEPRARTACSTLRQQSLDCIVVPPNGAGDLAALP